MQNTVTSTFIVSILKTRSAEPSHRMTFLYAPSCVPEIVGLNQKGVNKK